MPILKKTTLIFTLLCLTSLCWIGCSDDTIIKYIDTPADYGQTEAVETYFPLSEGYSTIYNVTYSSGNTEQVTFKAGKVVSFQGIEASEWIGTGNSSIDTGYFYASGNTLYYYSWIGAEPEKVLQLPLSIGSSWTTNDINTNDFTDIITGTKDEGGVNSKDFPTVTAVNFTVEATEPLTLGTGNQFSQAVRLSSPNGTRNNYYWYAPGVGLVRYVIGASTSSYPNGDVVGELFSYGH